MSQRGNHICNDGACAVADALRTNSSVQELIIVRWCPFLILLPVL
jgi:hypothetical protein